MDIKKKIFYKFKLRDSDIDKTIPNYELTL
jgi:hypothetical protein